MMLENTNPAELTAFGNVLVSESRIEINGFAGNNETSCRDVSLLACLWAIGVLQQEANEIARFPGGGISGIGDSPCEWTLVRGEEGPVSERYETECGYDVEHWAINVLAISAPPRYCSQCGMPVEVLK